MHGAYSIADPLSLRFDVPDLPFAASGTLTAVPLRSATPQDAASMLAIYGPYVTDTAISFETDLPTEAEFSARIERGLTNAPWLVLEQNEQILGYAYATEFRSRTAYDATRETTVYVSDGHKGAGVGRTLMTELLARLRADGIALAIAGITLPNDPSVGLHEHIGFKHVGTFHGVGRKFDEWHDVGFWELPLTRSSRPPALEEQRWSAQ